jgi:peptidoglycan biosynthesis protein MviN/MurJ (putative lipid II flippase)
MAVASQASYALRDAVSPFLATCVRAVLGVGGMVVGASLVSGAGVLVALGLSLSLADLLAAALLWMRLRRQLPRSRSGLVPPLARAFVCSALMAGPAYGVALLVGRLGEGHVVSITALAAAALTGTLIYLLGQRAFGSPELRAMRSALTAALGSARNRTEVS